MTNRRSARSQARRSCRPPRRLRLRCCAGRSFYSAAGGMIRIAISQAAFEAIAVTLPLGSVGSPPTNPLRVRDVAVGSSGLARQSKTCSGAAAICWPHDIVRDRGIRCRVPYWPVVAFAVAALAWPLRITSPSDDCARCTASRRRDPR